LRQKWVWDNTQSVFQNQKKFGPTIKICKIYFKISKNLLVVVFWEKGGSFFFVTLEEFAGFL